MIDLQGGILGIADDIKPKKYHRHFSQTEKIIVAEKQIEKAKDKVIDDLFNEQKDNDFFDGTPIAQSKINTKVKNLVEKETRQKKPKKTKNLSITILIILVIILSGTLIWQNYPKIKSFFIKDKNTIDDQKLSEIIDSTNNSSQNYSSESTDQAITSATNQTPASTIDKSAIKLSILNGTGVKSSAKTASDLLTNAGFTISYTGNAKSFNYQKTYIYHKSDGAEKANLVKENLANYNSEIILNDNVVGNNFDIVVVIGKN